MLKNKHYVYGPTIVQVPAPINFGDFILEKMWPKRDKIALINGATDEYIKYGEIIQESMNFALSLTRLGVRKGDTIGILSENRREFWGAVIGTACAGATLTPISNSYVKAELQHILDISKPVYIICSPTTYKSQEVTLKNLPYLKKIIVFGEDRYSDVLLYNDLTFERNNVIKNAKYEEFQSVEVQGQLDTLFIAYSSGTTGMPKGVMLTHLNVITCCTLPPSQDPKETNLFVNPWYHIMGFAGSLIAFCLGKTSVYIPKFDLDLYFNVIEKYKITQLSVVPAILVAACKYPTTRDLSSVKLIYSGAAPLHKDTAESAKNTFPNLLGVFQGYGATEVCLAVTRLTFDKLNFNKVGSVGSVLGNTILKVVDIDTRKPLGPNCPGEICAKGQLIMKGYIGRDRSEDFDEEGFFKTGDIGYYDDDKYFYIVDRLKELIKYKGYQVPPAELEAVLLQHPSIKEGAVIGIEDKMAGEVPLAFVVKQPGEQLSEKEVKDFVAARLSNPKHLRGGVRFVDVIPKSASGKILRRELRKMVNSAKSHL